MDFCKCGYGVEEMESFNKKAVALLSEIRNEFENPEETKMVLAGRLGPRGDGYFPDKHPRMTEKEAEDYHVQQIGWFAETEADMVNHLYFHLINVNVNYICIEYEIFLECSL